MPQIIDVPNQGLVEFPDGMSDADIVKAIKRTSMDYAKPQKVDPTEGMSTGQKLLAGVGKGFVDVGRGIGQRLGLVEQESILVIETSDPKYSETETRKLLEGAGSKHIDMVAE